MKNKLLGIISDIGMWGIIIIVICFRLLVYKDYIDYSIYPDTNSYVEYDKNILKGEIDEFRTPVYPYMIKLVSVFTNEEEYLYKGITLLQELLSIISVVILYKTLKKLLKNEVATYLGTIIYACLPTIFTYNRVIITESISISLYLMYFCLILRNIYQMTTKKIILIGIFTLVLILLRPAFLYLLVALGILYLMIFLVKKENRKQAVLGWFSILCVCIVILVYCYLNKIQNGVWGISNVTQINQLDTIIQMGIYQTGDERDKGIIEIMESNLDEGKTIWFRKTTDKIMGEYTAEEVDSYISRCIKNNFSIYFNKTIKKVLNIASTDCSKIYLERTSINIFECVVPFLVIYLYIFLESIYLLVQIIKTKKIRIEQFFMLTLILGHLAIIIIGAQAEYSRLFVTTLPIIVVSMVWHVRDMMQLWTCFKCKKTL